MAALVASHTEPALIIGGGGFGIFDLGLIVVVVGLIV